MFGTDIRGRAISLLRPLISPVEPIVTRVPIGSTVLDIGCGVGVVLFRLLKRGRAVSGLGWDVSEDAIHTARRLAQKRAVPSSLRFESVTGGVTLPSGRFGCVLLIDVMHHVAPRSQTDFLSECLTKVGEKGTFIYKDMASAPRWKAQLNRLHDYIFSGDEISYYPLEDVKKVCQGQGFKLMDEAHYSRFFYAHELLVFVRE